MTHPNDPRIGDMADVFAEYDRELEAQGKAELAAEKAAWDALPQAERDRITAARTAEWDAMADRIEAAAAKDNGTCSECGDDLADTEAGDGICYDCQNGVA